MALRFKLHGKFTGKLRENLTWYFKKYVNAAQGYKVEHANKLSFVDNKVDGGACFRVLRLTRVWGEHISGVPYFTHTVRLGSYRSSVSRWWRMPGTCQAFTAILEYCEVQQDSEATFSVRKLLHMPWDIPRERFRFARQNVHCWIDSWQELAWDSDS